jgi:hypothetical protein
VVRLIIYKESNYIVVLSRFYSMVVDKFYVLRFVVSASGLFDHGFDHCSVGGSDFNLYHII